MSFQVLRGAIFAFVNGLEGRLLDGVAGIEIAATNLIEVVMDTTQEVVSSIVGLIISVAHTVVGEIFNLFRVGLTIVLGRSAVEGEDN